LGRHWWVTYVNKSVGLTGGGAAVAICTTASIWRTNNTLQSGIVLVTASGSNSVDGGFSGNWVLSLVKNFGTYQVNILSSYIYNTGSYSFTFTFDSSNLYVQATGASTGFAYALQKLGGVGTG